MSERNCLAKYYEKYDNSTMKLLISSFTLFCVCALSLCDVENLGASKNHDIFKRNAFDGLDKNLEIFKKNAYEEEALDDEEHLFVKRGRLRKTGYNDAEIKAIVQAHNDYRAGVQPTASNMQKLSWDSRLERLAQDWSDACIYRHPYQSNTKYKGTGQNLFYSTGSSSDPSWTLPRPKVTKPTDEWYAEVDFYTYASDSCSDVCGHYTQVVLAKASKVGCGIKYCDPLNLSDGRSLPTPAWLVTCQYDAPNLLGERPYIEGKTTSNCPDGTSKNGLCRKCTPGENDCECNLKCSKGKKTKKCTCKCSKGYYGPTCADQCADEDVCNPPPGVRGFFPEHCEAYEQVRKQCPSMCGLC